MNKQLLELYTDYLLSTFGYATATGLSRLVEEHVTHDQITRFLSAEELTSKDLWALVKPTVREVEQDDAVLVFDDTIQEKPYTDENEVMCWHYDHTKGRAVQGFNLLNCLYHVNGTDIPVAFELIKKPVQYCDIKTRRLKRASLSTKNELMRDMLSVLVISMHNRHTLIKAVMEAGASGYILKDDRATIQQLGAVIGMVANGGIHFSQQAYQQLKKPREDTELTARQLEALSLCAAYPDVSTAELAQRLAIAHSTLRNLLSGAYTKLEVRTRMAAIGKARQLGLITPLEQAVRE